MNGFLYWCRFYQKKKYGAYVSYDLIVRLIPTRIWYDLLTVSHFWPSNHLAFLLHLIYDDTLFIRIQKQWKQIKAACGLLPEMNETLFEIFFRINETNIYTATWRSRSSQLHRLARLNASAKRYISWRQIWYMLDW